MRPTLVIRARVKVLGLLPGQEKVVAPNAAVQSLLRRGLIELVNHPTPDPVEAHAAAQEPAGAAPDGEATDLPAAQEGATEPSQAPDGAEPSDGVDPEPEAEAKTTTRKRG